MEGFVKGDVIILDFPFTDFKVFKRRPAVIIKTPKGQDVIICQITASSQEQSVEISINSEDFIQGNLRKNSYIRIDKITTINKSRIRYKIGTLKQTKVNEIIERLCDYIKS